MGYSEAKRAQPLGGAWVNARQCSRGRHQLLTRPSAEDHAANNKKAKLEVWGMSTVTTCAPYSADVTRITNHRRDVQNWWANATLQQVLIAAIALVLAYIVLSTVLGGLWHAIFGPRHHYHHGSAARHRAIVDTTTHTPPPPHIADLAADVALHGTADAEDADTLLSMLGQQPIVTHAADHAQHAGLGGHGGQHAAAVQDQAVVHHEQQQAVQHGDEAHHEPGELPPLEADWQQPRRGFGLYADDDDKGVQTDLYATSHTHHEPEDGVVDSIDSRLKAFEEQVATQDPLLVHPVRATFDHPGTLQGRRGGGEAAAPAPPVGVDRSTWAFNWTEYLSMYPALDDEGIVSEDAARKHYEETGRAKGMFPRLPRMFVQYTACRNLYEQFYSHLPTWAVALRVGAEVVLPPALVKDGQGSWQPAPTDVLLNTTAMQLAGSMLGMTMHKADDYAAIPSLDTADGVAGDDAFPLYAHRDIPASRTVRLHNLYAATRSLDDVAASLSMAVGEVGPRLKGSGEWDGEASGMEVLVNMPCTHFALDASSALFELERIAHLLYFPLPLITLAEEAVTTLHSLMSALPGAERLGRRRRHPRYNGIAVMGYDDYMTFSGDGARETWAAYERALLAELAASGAPCFIGFEDLQVVDQGWQRLESRLTVDAHLCSAVFHIGHALPAQRRHVLADQQLLLLDLMVLYKAHTVVANQHSLLGMFLAEFRHLPRPGGRVRGKVVRVALGGADERARGGLFTTRNAQGVVDAPRTY